MSIKIIPLSEVLIHRKQSITIQEETTYKRCRVQLHRRGVELRDAVKGFEIRTKKQQVCKAGDFIVAEMDAKFGGYSIIPEDLEGAIVSSHYYLFDIKADKLLPDFLRVLLNTEILQSQIKAKGSTNYSAVRPGDVLNWEIPLPDINEQRIIANHYLKTKGKSVLLEKEYDSQNKLISQLRQVLLKKAVEGTLLPQDPNDEPATKLLERIKAEKDALTKEGKLKKDNPVLPIKPDEIPFDIPDSWVWCRLADITNTITKGSSPKWQGINYVENPDEGIFFVTSKNVGNYNLLLHKKEYVQSKFNEIEPRSMLKKGDILTNIVGASIGRTALFDLDEIANINQAVCLIRIDTKEIDKQYMLHYFNSEVIVKQMFENQFAPGRANLSMGDISKFLVPLPPLQEQVRINSKLKCLMGFCEELEKSIQTSKEQVAHLLQSILKDSLQPKKEEVV